MYFHGVKSTAHPPIIGALGHSTDCIVKQPNTSAIKIYLHSFKHVVSRWKRNSGLKQRLHLQRIKHTDIRKFKVCLVCILLFGPKIHVFRHSWANSGHLFGTQQYCINEWRDLGEIHFWQNIEIQLENTRNTKIRVHHYTEIQCENTRNTKTGCTIANAVGTGHYGVAVVEP